MIHRIVALVCLLASLTNAHIRWQCPTPRSQQSAIKQGPCGVFPANNDILSTQFSKVEIQPGPLTVTFEETIPHIGSPVRIALSQEGVDDYEDCVLLNHVPHFDDARSNTVYTITIDIPDVQCENCALQVIQVMTDKIDAGTNCTYDVELSASFGTPGNCFSNYHSCSNVRINGSIPRDQYTCSEPSDWPFIEGFLPFNYTKTEAGAWGSPAAGSLILGGLGGDVNGGRIVPSRFNVLAPGCDTNFVPVDNGGVGGTAADNTDAMQTSSATMMGNTLEPAAMVEMSGVLALYSTYATFMYVSNSLLNFLL